MLILSVSAVMKNFYYCYIFLCVDKNLTYREALQSLCICVHRTLTTKTRTEKKFVFLYIFWYFICYSLSRLFVSKSNILHNFIFKKTLSKRCMHK